MTRRKVSRAGWLGSALCLGFLFLLAVAPSWFRKVNFSLPSDKKSFKETKNLPLDYSLPELKNLGKTTGKAVALKSFSETGQTLLINFWASWCPPCVEELPSLESLNRQLELRRQKDPKTPKLVTITVDETPADVWALYKTLDFTPSFVVLHDKGARFATSMGTTKFPETYWISSSGEILYKWLGPQNWLGPEVLQRLSQSPLELVNSKAPGH